MVMLPGEGPAELRKRQELGEGCAPALLILLALAFVALLAWGAVLALS